MINNPCTSVDAAGAGPPRNHTFPSSLEQKHLADDGVFRWWLFAEYKDETQLIPKNTMVTVRRINAKVFGGEDAKMQLCVASRGLILLQAMLGLIGNDYMMENNSAFRDPCPIFDDKPSFFALITPSFCR
jgi:hypothetical protein